MKIVVKNGKSEFNGNVIGLISELKANSEFVELWDKAEAEFDEQDTTLDLEADCVISFLNYALSLEHKPSKDEVVTWLIEYLG